MNIKLTPGFTVAVWDVEAGVRVSMEGCTDLSVSVLRPDESVVDRPAATTDDPQRIEIAWHDQDMSLPGIYVGEVSGTSPDGSPFVLSKAFKLRVG